MRAPHLISIKNSISIQLLKMVFSFYLLLTVTVTLIHMLSEYRHQKENILRELRIIQETFAPALTAAVWDFNTNQLNPVFLGMEKFPTVIGIQLKDRNGDTVGIVGTVQDESGRTVHVEADGTQQTVTHFEDLFWHQFDLIHTDQHQKQHYLGTATVYSSAGIVLEKVQLGYIFIVVNAIVKTVALWGIFLWVARWMLSHPLAHLAEATQHVQWEHLQEAKINISTKGNNELKILETSFNLMIDKLFKARQLIQDHHEQLEHNVAKRTEELRNALAQLETQHQELQQTQLQLVQSEKMAGLGTLVAGVAHEINNPNNFVFAGYGAADQQVQSFKNLLFDLLEDADAEILQEFEMRFDRISQALGSIKNGGTRIQTIVDDLRTFSRIDNTEMDTLSLAEHLSSTIRLIQTRYQEQVVFTCEIPSHYHVSGYPSQLSQVFMNVIMNGCQAIEQRQHEPSEAPFGTLMIHAKRDDQEICVSFQDDGVGMTEETLSQVFDPFFTTKPVGEGTGLGLAISYGIIERHHGRITIQSTAGEGTCVQLFLPIAHPSQESSSRNPT